jgi:DNA-binding PadR family transcriptional regulator
MAARSDLLQGTLDLLILKALSLGPRHGLGVSRRIAQLTRNEFLVANSLFPAARLKEKGCRLVGHVETNRRALRLTAGKRQLHRDRSWCRSRSIARSRRGCRGVFRNLFTGADRS